MGRLTRLEVYWKLSNNYEESLTKGLRFLTQVEKCIFSFVESNGVISRSNLDELELIFSRSTMLDFGAEYKNGELSRFRDNYLSSIGRITKDESIDYNEINDEYKILRLKLKSLGLNGKSKRICNMGTIWIRARQEFELLVRDQKKIQGILDELNDFEELLN